MKYSSRKNLEDLTYDLINAFALTNNVKESALFLQDLITKKEAIILGKRLRIAKLLLQGKTYEDIVNILNVSHGTVAKISAWLAERGEGFRQIVMKLPKQKEEKMPQEISDWDKLKRRHPMYFWPELLLEEILKKANKKDKDRIRKVLENLDVKNELHRNIEKFLKV